MRIRPTEPLGVIVDQLDLRHLTDDDVASLVDALADRGVAAFPEQHLDDDEFVAFLSRFGELTFTMGETPVDGHPDLNLVTNVGRTRPPRSSFHTDTSYVQHPPAYTALRAVEVPGRGGATLFTDQYRAAATLSGDVRRRVDGRSITHVVTGLDAHDLAETEADHPVLRHHPISDRPALFITTPPRCSAVSGMDAAESAAMIELLFEHSTTKSNTLRHDWSAGEVLMWDNACVLHCADHSDVEGHRVFHRGMVAARPECT